MTDIELETDDGTLDALTDRVYLGLMQSPYGLGFATGSNEMVGGLLDAMKQVIESGVLPEEYLVGATYMTQLVSSLKSQTEEVYQDYVSKQPLQ